ncbi:hypothetical protein GUITHDRAFT_139780 [Guillardia theta CCMP2712]|uniref:Uncharacterized protein n=1 Tax=Guillardia theta (strain CCMP2712) TaxID=905079 RepID=L1J7P9_GUITC|nr:hypothetical protein GUITHDRAFT_139780 [Guillardia theta CCMP2712]EKX44556.1 hypothetical protein GUITHDRAFT_139780 [Guillardia theta CCMP2712]|eukprot:XP_005831536.1 hypothetical protein GUITHDRAFT_139780 [Guillardia theta CCMP2712]
MAARSADLQRQAMNRGAPAPADLTYQMLYSAQVASVPTAFAQSYMIPQKNRKKKRTGKKQPVVRGYNPLLSPLTENTLGELSTPARTELEKEICAKYSIPYIPSPLADADEVEVLVTQENARPGDVVKIAKEFARLPFFRKYSGRTGLLLRSCEAPGGSGWIVNFGEHLGKQFFCTGGEGKMNHLAHYIPSRKDFIDETLTRKFLDESFKATQEQSRKESADHRSAVKREEAKSSTVLREKTQDGVNGHHSKSKRHVDQLEAPGSERDDEPALESAQKMSKNTQDVVAESQLEDRKKSFWIPELQSLYSDIDARGRDKAHQPCASIAAKNETQEAGNSSASQGEKKKQSTNVLGASECNKIGSDNSAQGNVEGRQQELGKEGGSERKLKLHNPLDLLKALPRPLTLLLIIILILIF